MIWQDILFMFGQAAFTLALVPALRGRQKPPRSTCALTGLTLVAYAVAFTTLGLWWSAGSTAVCAACWLTLWGQKR